MQVPGLGPYTTIKGLGHTHSCETWGLPSLDTGKNSTYGEKYNTKWSKEQEGTLAESMCYVDIRDSNEYIGGVFGCLEQQQYLDERETPRKRQQQ